MAADIQAAATTAILAEVVRASVHGLVTLRRDHRLRPGEDEARAAALVELIGGRKKGG
ncbi:hypothetical protein [Nocardiopsis alba]|uniref:hypothetical protein n=1 Tax=Nocardiopsis alba TaxID=53437 RepID=UPI0035DF46CB